MKKEKIIIVRSIDARYMDNINYRMAKCVHCSHGLFRERNVRNPTCFLCKMRFRREKASMYFDMHCRKR